MNHKSLAGDQATGFERLVEQFNSSDQKFWFCFVSYGVTIGIQIQAPIRLESLVSYLPPGWKSSSSTVADVTYTLLGRGNGQGSNHPHYELYRAEERLIEAKELPAILATLDSDLRLQIGMATPEKLFVHAGVVAWRGKAIVIPGRSFSGKTTLVASLVEAGATYYSDEYALFDSEGRVHPYPRLLSIRQINARVVKRCPVEALGGQAGVEPLSVGLIVHTHYQSGSLWQPQKMSPGETVFALLDNTIVAQLKPEFALSTLSKVASGPLAVQGERGDAQDTSVMLLKQLEDWIGSAPYG